MSQALRKHGRELESLPDSKRFNGQDTDPSLDLQLLDGTVAAAEEECDSSKDFGCKAMRSLDEEVSATFSTVFTPNFGDEPANTDICGEHECQTLVSESGIDLCYLLKASDDELGSSPNPVLILKEDVCQSGEEILFSDCFWENLDVKCVNEIKILEDDFDNNQQLRFLSKSPSRTKSLLVLLENLNLRTPEISPHRKVAGQLFDGTQQRDMPQLCREQQIQKPSVSFQVCITLLTGKTLLLWVRSSDLVLDLKHKLNLRVGIPAASQRLLFRGKQREDLFPLSVYNIQRNAAIILSLRLRGGAAGQSSSAATFSYKDAVHAEKPKNAAPPVQGPKPFLVDKLEDTPSIEIKHPTMDKQFQLFAEKGIICRFNGLWPRTEDLYKWVHSNWTNNCKVLLCSKGFFIVIFVDDEDYQKALTEGPWFWNSAGLFLTPWFPDFDPSTATITKLPIWVRLPNLPAHLWHFVVFEGIGNKLGRHLAIDTSRGEKGIYTFTRICAEIDMSKGLPDQIILKIGDFHWTQSLDYENTAFRCRNCHLTGHLHRSCPAIPAQKKKTAPKPKSKSWKPCDTPPMDDFCSSSDEEVENEDGMADSPDQNLAPSGPVEPSAPPLSQKRSHETSPSDSDKEISPSSQHGTLVLPSNQDQLGWVKVGKKKGKKRVALRIPVKLG